MYNYLNFIREKFIKAKKGVTLMEIMIALLILAFAFLPIIAVIGTSTKDTDVANSMVFAQTTARNILDTLLDDVPFNSIITTGNNIAIAKIQNYRTYNADSFLGMFGAKSDEAKGEVIDERGITYEITIYAVPIEASDNENHNVANEMLFSYLPRPLYEGDTLEDNEKWYTYEQGQIHMKESAPDPYTIDVATATKNAFELGARENNSTHCIMKKILLKMNWIARDGHERSIELYTMKANLDSDGKE